MTRVPRPAEGARDGRQAAERSITSRAEAGMDADAIARHHDDAAARLLSEAGTPGERSYADSYSFTGDALVSDLRDLEREPPRLIPGTPHPDPFLADRGWEASRHGVWVRTGTRTAAPDIELEAG